MAGAPVVSGRQVPLMNRRAVKRHKVLVVDDDEATRLGLSEFLEAEGFATRSAGTFEEAQYALRCDPPDLLIADIRLGEFTVYSLWDALPSIGGRRDSMSSARHRSRRWIRRRGCRTAATDGSASDSYSAARVPLRVAGFRHHRDPSFRPVEPSSRDGSVRGPWPSTGRPPEWLRLLL